MSVGAYQAGEGASSPLQMPAKGWLAVLRRTWQEVGEDNVGIIAAGIAFYIFAAIVPTLGAVVLSYGLFADGDTVRQNVEAVFASLPRDAAAVITDQLLTVTESAKDKQGIGLVVALVLAWYGATKGSSAIITGLNVAYDTEETRGFFRLNALQFAVVSGGVLVIFVAIGTTMMLAFVNGLIPGAPSIVLAIVRFGSYALLGLLVMTAAAVLFRYGPDHRRPRWVWLSPGSIGATFLWLAGTAAFGFYVSHFGNYGATYGSLSAVIVTLTWLWLSAYVFLLGAELNAELERQVEGRNSTAEPSTATSDSLPPATADKSKVDGSPRSTLAGTLGSLAGHGTLATIGFAMLRRGYSSGSFVVVIAAAAAWHKRPSRSVGSVVSNQTVPIGAVKFNSDIRRMRLPRGMKKLTVERLPSLWQIAKTPTELYSASVRLASSASPGLPKPTGRAATASQRQEPVAYECLQLNGSPVYTAFT